MNIFGPLVATIPPVEEEDPFHNDFGSIIKGEPGCVLIFGVAQLVKTSGHSVYANACRENMLCAGKERSNWKQHLSTYKLVLTPKLMGDFAILNTGKKHQYIIYNRCASLIYTL